MVGGGFSECSDIVFNDSMINDKPSRPQNLLLNAISQLIGCKSSFKLLITKPSQQDNFSCGVFAPAFATALAFRFEPEEVNFNNGKP